MTALQIVIATVVLYSFILAGIYMIGKSLHKTDDAHIDPWNCKDINLYITSFSISCRFLGMFHNLNN